MNETENNKPCCGEGSDAISCSCSSEGYKRAKPLRRNVLKMAFCLVVLIAAVSIIAFKVVSIDNENSSDNSGDVAFALTQPDSENTALLDGDTIQPEQDTDEVLDTFDEPAPVTTETDQPEQNLGEYLGLFDDLNIVAFDADAVCVLIPLPENELIDDTVKSTIIKFQQDLEESYFTLDLFTLACDSPDYPVISRQLELPAVLVAVKGASTVPISCSDVNEYTLYQAFQACCDTSSGCCPN